MSPINLLLRFLLEITALTAAGIWAWKTHDGIWKYILVVAIPVLLAVLWGVFAVPDDPSRSGNTVVVTPGIIRLILELGLFGFAAWAFMDVGWIRLGWVFAIVVVVHYVVSYERVIWLLNR